MGLLEKKDEFNFLTEIVWLTEILLTENLWLMKAFMTCLSFIKLQLVLRILNVKVLIFSVKLLKKSDKICENGRSSAETLVSNHNFWTTKLLIIHYQSILQWKSNVKHPYILHNVCIKENIKFLFSIINVSVLSVFSIGKLYLVSNKTFTHTKNQFI